MFSNAHRLRERAAIVKKLRFMIIIREAADDPYQ
jgi:hypothetical protein